MTAGSATCGKCGAVVTAGARFCMSCGFDVSGAQGDVATRMVASSATQQLRQGVLEALRNATLGEYEILAELGAGGMATVFLAHDIHLDRRVAVKVMNPQLVAGEDMVERFKLEARTAAGLSHPHVIPIYAVKEQNDLLFFVMKFVEGRPLDSIIKKEAPLPVPMVRQIVGRVAEALGYAHRRGVVHRDIKPANIMIDTEGLPIVTDFGIAKVADRQGLTMTGATIGTPTYMSPEQCNAQPITGASDQYSLGVLAYEMLTGRAMFEGESVMTIMFKHVHEAPPDLRTVSTDCPPDLAEAIMRMVAKDPRKRFEHMEQVVKAVAAPALAFDDPMRTKLIEFAMQGENRTVLQRVSTPRSPFPASGKRPAPKAATAPGTGSTVRPSQEPTEVMASAERAGPRPRRRGGLVAVVAGVGVVGVGVLLAVLQPWRGAPGGDAEPVAQEPPDPGGTGADQGPPLTDAAPVAEPSGTETPPVATPPAPTVAGPAAPARIVRLEILNAPSALDIAEIRDLSTSAIEANGQPRAGAQPTWTSSDPRIVTVQNGRVRAVAPGTATVTAALDGTSDAVTIVVHPDRVASVSIQPAILSLEAGGGGRLVATVIGEQTGTLSREPAWESSDARVATVDAAGQVTAHAAGSATITATADGRQATAQVTVTPRPLTEEELRQRVVAAIQEYAEAIESKNVARIKVIYPAMPAQQEARLIDALPRMESLDVSLTVGRIFFTRENTEATAAVTGRWYFRADGSNRESPADNTYLLQRVGDGRWVIMEIR